MTQRQRQVLTVVLAVVAIYTAALLGCQHLRSQGSPWAFAVTIGLTVVNVAYSVLYFHNQFRHGRLSFEVISIAPLRERPEDVEVFAQHFLDRFLREIPHLAGKRLARSTIEALEAYPFPGNVRELENLIERAAYRDVTNEITPEDLGLPQVTAQVEVEIPRGSFEVMVDAYKSRLVARALDEAGGNQAGASRALGLSYHQYRYLLRKYAVEASS